MDRRAFLIGLLGSLGAASTIIVASASSIETAPLPEALFAGGSARANVSSSQIRDRSGSCAGRLGVLSALLPSLPSCLPPALSSLLLSSVRLTAIGLTLRTPQGQAAKSPDC